MKWGNMYFKDGKLVPHLEGDPKTTKHKIFWVHHNKHARVHVKSYGSKMEDPCVETEYLADYDMVNVKKGEKVEMMRINYMICEKEVEGDGPLVLIGLPRVS